MIITLNLPELPFAQNSMDSIISEESFAYHYGKHHASYVSKLNGLVNDTILKEKSITEIIRYGYNNRDVELFNNSAQHWNHSFFWNCLTPNGGGIPTGNIKNLINRDFGSFEIFKEKFSNESAKLFGSGWTWLVQNKFGKLEIVPLKEANTPLVSDKKPILTLDVWEHAYYIDYRNARPKFINGFWEIVNWDFANKNVELK